ncbi:hypothetical protein D9M68_495090 [compost metagenome]
MLGGGLGRHVLDPAIWVGHLEVLDAGLLQALALGAGLHIGLGLVALLQRQLLRLHRLAVEVQIHQLLFLLFVGLAHVAGQQRLLNGARGLLAGAAEAVRDHVAQTQATDVLARGLLDDAVLRWLAPRLAGQGAQLDGLHLGFALADGGHCLLGQGAVLARVGVAFQHAPLGLGLDRLGQARNGAHVGEHGHRVGVTEQGRGHIRVHAILADAGAAQEARLFAAGAE